MIKYKINPKNSDSYNISQDQLADFLLAYMNDNFDNPNLESLDDLVKIVSKKLISLDKSYFDTTQNQLFSIYFLVGYYYKLFLTKNNVQVIDTEIEKDS